MVAIVRDEFRIMKDQFSEITSSLNCCSNKINEFEAAIRQINSEFRLIEKIVEENESLHAAVATLTDRVEVLESRTAS